MYDIGREGEMTHIELDTEILYGYFYATCDEIRLPYSIEYDIDRCL